MWVLVFFDLPTNTKEQRMAAAKFRKYLITDGFQMFQYSVYMRNCPSAENAAVHSRRVKCHLPPDGHVGMITITDKQFGSMELFFQKKVEKPPEQYIQLELF